MCGLIGLIPKSFIDKENMNLFKQALYVGALRGTDGTGIFRVAHSNKTEVTKLPASSGALINKINQENIPLHGKALVGHNRAATKGSHIYENTHPFKEGNITLVHNGTLWLHKHLADTDVDSHAICHALNNMTPQEVVNDINGAYALIWYDERDKNIHVLRNKERPLHLFNTKEFFFLTSEKEMGQWLLSRNRIQILSSEEIKVDTIYSFDVSTKVNKPVKTPCVPKVIVTNLPVIQEKLKEKKDTLFQDEEMAFFVSYLEEMYNVKKNDTIDVKLTTKEEGVSTNHRYTGHLLLDKDYKIVLYTKENLPLNQDIEVIYKTILYLATKEYALLCVPLGITKDNFNQKVNFKTTNGFTVDAKFNSMMLHEKCSCCKRDYVADENMEISGVYINNTLIRYKYICHTCNTMEEVA